VEENGGAGGPLCDHLPGVGIADEAADHLFGVAGGGDDVEVPHGLPAPAETAGDDDPLDVGARFEIAFERCGMRLGLGVEEAPARFFGQQGGVEDLFFELGTQAGEGADAVRFGGRFELIEGGDTELFVEDPGPFGADPFDVEQIGQVGREVLFELFELAESAGADDLLDLGGDVLTDAGAFGQVGSLFHHALEASRQSRDRSGGVAVGADLERIGPFDRQQICQLLEHLCDLCVAEYHHISPCDILYCKLR